jgi:hypothetical protein
MMTNQVNEEVDEDILPVYNDLEFNRVVCEREERTGKMKKYRKVHHHHGPL